MTLLPDLGLRAGQGLGLGWVPGDSRSIRACRLQAGVAGAWRQVRMSGGWLPLLMCASCSFSQSVHSGMDFAIEQPFSEQPSDKSSE